MSAEGSYGGPERRAAPRYKVNFHARWGGEEWGGREATVGDLSADGCFVLTDDMVAEGELVQVQVELPNGDPLPLWGSVIHRVEGRGFAIRFSTFSQGGARERLGALLREAGGTTT